MKICIPTKDSNPNLSSKVTNCPLEAKAFILYNTNNEESRPFLIHDITVQDSSEMNLSTYKKLGIDSVVANSFCKEFRDNNKIDDVELWQCTASTVRDTINIFKMGGSFLFSEKQLVDHRHPIN
ncbi:MAG: hypothetical protein GPJ54_22695 [Candidatus Heimdallarchaeota archaeon]|nr:hypothetical protein [Candidatus Heimdallarchaeota archaeon]